MQKSETISLLAAALCKAQPKIGVAIKDKVNPAFKSKYADLGAVWEAARPALQEHGLAVMQLPATDEPGYAALETIVLHESGEYISSVSRAKIVKDDPQGYGSAITFLRRYALSAALGIVADVDDDGHAASHGTPTAPPRQAQKAQQPAARPNTAPAPAPADSEPLGNEKGARLHAQLGALLKGTRHEKMTHPAFATPITGREVAGLSELTRAESVKVYNAAKLENEALAQAS